MLQFQMQMEGIKRFLLKKQSNKLSLCQCFVLFMVVPIDPAKEPIFFFILIKFPRLLLMGSVAGGCRNLPEKCRKLNVSENNLVTTLS